MNPFNPCLPDLSVADLPALDDENTGAPFDGPGDWYALN